MIVDAQTNFWKKKFLSPNALTFIKNMCKILNIEPIFDATPKEYIVEMEEAQIKKAIISTNDFSFGSTVSQIKYNAYISKCVNEYPDLFLGQCGVDPRKKNAVEIFQKGLDAGLCGLKLYPGTGFRADDEICFPLYKIAEDNNIPVSIHTGFTCSPFLIQNSNPFYIERVLEEFQTLKVNLCTQLGFPFTYEMVGILRKYENLYTDYAPTNIDVPQMGIAQNIVQIKTLTNRHNIMFATYWPFTIGRVKEWTDINKKIKLPSITRLFNAPNITKEDREYMLGLTACEFFKIK
ncbi:MAG: amidohydrolase family protein [Candidatus Hodarchaeota archaeon]